MASMTLRRCVVAGRYASSSTFGSKQQQPILIRCQSSSGRSSKPESLLDSAAHYYSQLRWRIATSLTESLSKDEQKVLLGRLNIENPQEQKGKSEEEIQQETKHSIQEAVAAARAEEAQKLTAALKQQQAKLTAEAEEATRKRVENELIIQQRRLNFETWQKDVEKDKEEQQQKLVAEKEEQQESFYQEPTAISDHPILGTAIVDLGYKRIHITSIQVLKTLPVWKKQRTYRHKRAKDMAEDKMKTLHLGMPGIIALYEDSKGALSIIDGQHRVAMMTLLEEKKEAAEDQSEFFDLDSILVEVFPEDNQQGTDSSSSETASSAHAQEIFLEINKAEPVKLVDLPGIKLTEKDRKVINDGASRLEEAFPDMFSNSQRCRSPHLNIDNLRDALFASEIIKRHGLKSAKALETWMLEQNQKMKQEYTSETSQKAKTVTPSALKKAIKFDFFLGLDSSWLYA